MGGEEGKQVGVEERQEHRKAAQEAQMVVAQ